MLTFIPNEMHNGYLSPENGRSSTRFVPSKEFRINQEMAKVYFFWFVSYCTSVLMISPHGETM